MIVLGLDTCLNTCSVAVRDGERVLAHALEPMARGHQERLAPMAADAEGLVFPAIDARRGQLYLQAFENGRALMAPDALTAGDAAARIVELSQGASFTLVGSGAALLAGVSGGARTIEAPGCDARAVARLAAMREPGPLKPLYLRAPDAKLPA